MRCHEIAIPGVSVGEWHYWTPLADAHIDAAASNKGELKKLVSERNKLPNHRWIMLGDVANLVVPSDRKRHSPSGTIAELARSEDYLADAIEYFADVLDNIEPDLWAYGNHEAEYLKRHHADPIKAMARRFGGLVGGYSGFLTYRMQYKSGHHSERVAFLYHHGRGLWPWLVRWAFKHTGWDVAIAGHRHIMGCQTEAITRPVSRGEGAPITEKRQLVMCGGFYDSGSSPEPVPYAERMGLAQTPIGAPLIKCRIMHRAGHYAKPRGLPQWYKEIKVEI